MATKAETNAVYAAGLIQGITLVTFPAASTIFTDPEPVRPVQHPVRDHVPAPGRDGDHGFAAEREAGAAVRDQTRFPGRPGRGPGVDGAAHHQRVLHRQPAGGLRPAAGGNRLPGGRLRPDGAGHQRAHRRVSPRPGRRVGAGAERPAGAGHRIGAGVRGHLRRPGVLVGAAGPVVGPAGDTARGQRGPAAARRAGERAAAGGRPGSRGCSGCSPRSRSCMASARR